MPHLRPEGLLPLESRAGDYCSELNDCEDSSESEGGRDGAKGRERERENEWKHVGDREGPVGPRVHVLRAWPFVG